MNAHQNIIKINVDTHNPGQFFACCGLFELAHRLWKGTEGWFEESNGQTTFCLQNLRTEIYADLLLNELRTCPIEGVSIAEKDERKELDNQQKTLKKQNQKLSEKDQNRLSELGKLAREGALYIGKSFVLRLDWWRSDDDSSSDSVKTWAGRQEIHKIARSAQDALLGIAHIQNILNEGRLLMLPDEYKSEDSEEKSVVPFCFDPRKFAHSLDVGYSLDVQQIRSVTYPAV